MKKQVSIKYTTFFNARLTSTISISLVLFILGVIAMMSIMTRELSIFVKENIGFSIVLADDIKDYELKKIQKQLSKAKYVRSVEYITKEQALKELTKELGENPKDFLGFNPLQASLEVRLKSDYANNDSIKVIEKKIKKNSYIREVVYRKDLIQLVNDNMKRIGLILFVIASILMVISFALISNTIRLGVYSKRFLIHTMKLVGATSGFIRAPFIKSNIINGIIASIIAMGMLTGCIFYLMNELDGFQHIIHKEMIIIVYGIVLILGILLTAVSSYFAVNKYLKMRSDDLYYI